MLVVRSVAACHKLWADTLHVLIMLQQLAAHYAQSEGAAAHHNVQCG